MKDSRFPFTLRNALLCLAERSTLFMGALSHKSDDELNHSHPVVMTTTIFRTELEIEYGRRSVEQPLVVALKSVEKDKTIANNVVGTKSPSEAWKILTSMVDDDSSERTTKQAKKTFEVKHG